SPGSDKSGEVRRELNEAEKRALQAPRKQYDETLVALRKREQDAKELFDRIANIKGDSKKQDNMAMTFAATHGAVKVDSELKSGVDVNSNKAETCVKVYGEALPDVTNAVKGFCPEEPGKLARELLKGVRERLETQMYEPGNRGGRVDNADKDALVDLFHPESSSMTEEEGLRERFQFAKRQRRAEFEQEIWKSRAFGQDGKLDVDRTVAKMSESLSDKSRASGQDGKQDVDGTVAKTSESLSDKGLSEPMLDKLRDWIVFVDRKKNDPYGSRFVDLKQGVLTSMGVYDLPGLVSKMTRSEFKNFQDLYEEKMVEGALAKISKSVLIDPIVREEMKIVPPGTLNKKKMKVLREALENYARAFVEKAMTTFSDTPHISDELMWEVGQGYELVEGATPDSWGLKHRITGEWGKWSGEKFKSCSRKESEESYASNKHLLCCFDEGIFAPWKAPATTPPAEKAGVDNNPKEEMKPWVPVSGDKIMLQNEGGMAFHQINSMIEEKQKILDESLKEVEAFCEKAVTELSRLAAIRVTDGNANIADLSDKNRPQKLGEQWNELYNNQNTDVLLSLEPLFPNVDETYEPVKVANKMVRHCYEAVCDLVDKEKQGLSDALSMVTQAGLHEERYRELRRDLKSLKNVSIETKTDLIAEQLVDSVCKRLGSSEYNPVGKTGLPNPKEDLETWKSKPETKQWLQKYGNENTQNAMIAKVYTRRFLKDACMLIYKMRSHEPPVVLKWKPDEEVLIKEDRNNWADYETKIKPGMKVDFVVWPTICLHEGEDAPILNKGVLKPKKG
ncbi:MAG: hypothetical protein ACPG5T_03115, partial [Endozoicomonas sp.]